MHCRERALSQRDRGTRGERAVELFMGGQGISEVEEAHPNENRSVSNSLDL